MIEDSKGRIWVGTKQGTGFFDPVSLEFQRLIQQPEEASSLLDNRVECLFEDPSGDIWVGMIRGGLSKFNPKDSSFINYSRQEEQEKGPIVRLICQDPIQENLLWVSDNKGLKYFDKTSQQLKEIDPNLNSLGAPFDLDFEGDSVIWIATYHRGLFRYSMDQKELRNYTYSGESKWDGSHDQIYRLLRDGNRGYWLNTVDKGFGHFNFQTETFQFFSTGEASSYKILPPPALQGLHRDRSGIIWIGHRDGLSLYDPRVQHFNWYRHEKGTESEFPATNTVLEQGFQDMVWAGSTTGDGIISLDLNTGKQEKIPFIIADDNGKHNPGIWSMLQLPDSSILTLSGYGLHQYNPVSKTWSPFLKTTHCRFARRQEFALKTFLSHSGQIWVGTHMSGLVRIDLETLKSKRFLKPDGNSSGGHPGLRVIVSIQEDHQGNIWAGGKEGLVKLDPGTGNAESYFYHPDSVQGLSSEFVFGIEIDESNYVWAGTRQGGLNRINPNLSPQQEIEKLGVEQGLGHNSIWAMTKDPQGRIWGTHDEGLFVLDPGLKQILNFSTAEGFDFPRLEPKLSIGPSGRIYVSLNEGFCYFQSDSLYPNPQIPPIRLTGFTVNTVPQSDSLINEIQTQGNRSGKPPLPLEFEHDHNFLGFEFTALSYSSPQNNRYRYRMVGLNDNWVELGHRNFVEFPALEAGSYQLEIMAANNERVWNPQPLTLTILIHPPWWRQWWFYGLIALLVLGLIYAFFQYRLRQLRKRDALKANFNKKIAELELSALRAQMNPHFLFNCLNSINRFIVRNDAQKASEYLTDFATLIRLILKNSEQELVSLQNELDALNLYIQMESLRFEHQFEYELVLSPDLQADFVRIPPMILQPYVENAIWHGLMHLDEPGKLRIAIHRLESHLECLIEDSGIGREAAEKLRSKGAQKDKSMGMRITKQRLLKFGAAKNLKAEIQVHDLRNIEGKGIGTQVVLKIPI